MLAHRQSLVERRGCEGDGAGIAPSVGIEAERIKLLACARAQSGGDGDHARVCTLHMRGAISKAGAGEMLDGGGGLGGVGDSGVGTSGGWAGRRGGRAAPPRRKARRERW